MRLENTEAAVRIGDLSKAFSLTGAAAAVWLKALTRRNVGSQRLRSDLRSVYFRSHAKIRELPAAAFCERFHDGGARPETLQIPVACTESVLGGPAYYLTLAAIAAARQPNQIVEFGTFLGHGTSVLAMNAPNARILTIDLPDEAGDVSNLNDVDQSHVQSSRKRVGQSYRGTACEGRIKEVKCDSRRLRLKDLITSADLLLIDGGHDMGCISADTENALSVAGPGTVILWDDYFWLYPDVIEYLNHVADRFELVRLGETGLVGHVC
jgi:predicted O-methyltransferase YrrM